MGLLGRCGGDDGRTLLGDVIVVKELGKEEEVRDVHSPLERQVEPGLRHRKISDLQTEDVDAQPNADEHLQGLETC